MQFEAIVLFSFTFLSCALFWPSYMTHQYYISGIDGGICTPRSRPKIDLKLFFLRQDHKHQPSHTVPSGVRKVSLVLKISNTPRICINLGGPHVVDLRRPDEDRSLLIFYRIIWALNTVMNGTADCTVITVCVTVLSPEKVRGRFGAGGEVSRFRSSVIPFRHNRPLLSSHHRVQLARRPLGTYLPPPFPHAAILEW